MKTENLTPNIIRFIIVAALQVLVFNNLEVNLLGWQLRNALIFPFFILLLPITMTPVLIIVLSFVLGITIDLFSFSPGIYASTAVFLGFFRNIILRITEPREGYKISTILSPRYFKLGWYLKTISILIGVASLWYTFVIIFSFKEPIYLLLNFVFVFLVSLVINLLALFILNFKR